MHEELKAMVGSGLAPQEALSASVINGPEFFGLSKYYGSIEAGKVANLILLAKNPMEDIENIASIETVIKGGDIYDKQKLGGCWLPLKTNSERAARS